MAGTIQIKRRVAAGAPGSLAFGELAWGDAAANLYVGTNGGSVAVIGGSGKAASGANSDITSLAGLTTALSIAQGGTGQTTAAAAFNAFSPTTTLGDLIYASGPTTDARLPGNTTTAKNFLVQTGTGSVSAAPAWSALFGSDVPVFTASGGSVPGGAASRAGAVPDPGASAGTTKYLREDGTWVAPPNLGGTVTAVSVVSANGFAGSSSGGATPALTITTTITGLLKGNGTAISAAVAGTDYLAPNGNGSALTNLAAGSIATGQVALARGGTNADLSATGGAGFVLKQSTAGAAITVAALVAGDLPAHSATLITSGLMALARGGTNADLSATGGAGFVLKQSSTGATITVAALAAGDIPALDASKITTGLMALARGGTNANLSATGGAGQYLKQVSSGAAVTVGTIPAGDLPTLNNITAPNAAVAFNGQRATGLADPTSAQDAATKAYVDATSVGLDVKTSMRAATTPATSLGAVTYANGTNGVGATITGPTNTALPVIDGVTLVVGDRLLVKDASVCFSGVTGAGAGGPNDANGLYSVTSLGSGASQWVLTRAVDADTNKQTGGGTVPDELTPGTFTFVEAGTVNAASGWVLSTSTAITIGTTAIVFSQFSGQGTFTAAAAGALTLTGGAFSVNTDGVTTFILSNNVAVRSTATVGQVLRSTGSTAAAAAWGALDLTSNNAVSGALGATHGGTGQSAYAVGDLLWASSTTALSKFPIGTNGQFLTVNSGANGYTWTSTIDGGTY